VARTPARPGARVRGLKTGRGNAELHKAIDKATTGEPLWGAGAFTRHIALGFFRFPGSAWRATYRSGGRTIPNVARADTTYLEPLGLR
jgi:hypothetical protein